MENMASLKERQIEFFKKGSINQSALLKTLKAEISEMLIMEFKPGEIKNNLELTYEIKIDKTNLYAWLKYHKKELLQGEQKNEEKSIERPPHGNTKKGSSDVLEKESDGEVKTLENDVHNDSEKPLEKESLDDIFNSTIEY